MFIVIALIVSSLLTILVFFLLHRRTMGKRTGLSVLSFLASLFVILVAISVIDSPDGLLNGHANFYRHSCDYKDPTVSGCTTTEIAKVPVQFGGAAFPAGSQLTWWVNNARRKTGLYEAANKNGVMLDTLRIVHLSEYHIGADDGIFAASLAYDQTIDGWPCSHVNYVELTVKPSSPPRLQHCGLSRTTAIDNVTWPAGTDIIRRANNAWQLDHDTCWQTGNGSRSGDGSMNCSPHDVFPEQKYLPPFGLSVAVDEMEAIYNQALRLKTWHGNTSETKFHGILFSRLNLRLLENRNDILMSGFEANGDDEDGNGKQAGAFYCWMTQIHSGTMQRCTASQLDAELRREDIHP